MAPDPTPSAPCACGHPKDLHYGVARRFRCWAAGCECGAYRPAAPAPDPYHGGTRERPKCSDPACPGVSIREVCGRCGFFPCPKREEDLASRPAAPAPREPFKRCRVCDQPAVERSWPGDTAPVAHVEDDECITALKAALTAARARADRAEGELDAANQHVRILTEAQESHGATIARLRAALEEYGSHKSDCRASMGGEERHCNCGYRRALGNW